MDINKLTEKWSAWFTEHSSTQYFGLGVNLNRSEFLVVVSQIAEDIAAPKFTDEEVSLLTDMADFPSAFKLTDKGEATVNSLLKKIKPTE